MARRRFVTYTIAELETLLREIEDQQATGVLTTSSSAGDVTSSGEASGNLEDLWQTVYDELSRRDPVQYPPNPRISRTSPRMFGQAHQD